MSNIRFKKMTEIIPNYTSASSGGYYNICIILQFLISDECHLYLHYKNSYDSRLKNDYSVQVIDDTGKWSDIMPAYLCSREYSAPGSASYTLSTYGIKNKKLQKISIVVRRANSSNSYKLSIGNVTIEELSNFSDLNFIKIYKKYTMPSSIGNSKDSYPYVESDDHKIYKVVLENNELKPELILEMKKEKYKSFYDHSNLDYINHKILMLDETCNCENSEDDLIVDSSFNLIKNAERLKVYNSEFCYIQSLKNSLVVNSEFSYISESYFSTIVNSIGSLYAGKNNIYWNVDGDLLSPRDNFYSHPQDVDYADGMSIGYTNDYVQFIDTGMTVQGRHELQIDENNYETEIIPTLGDFRLSSESWLKGWGTYDEDTYIATDINGDARDSSNVTPGAFA